MKKEILIVKQDEIDDYTNTNCIWEIKGERYKYIEHFRTNGDGEWYRVIVQRESDNKYFAFDWGYGDTRNFYEEEWEEVEKKEIIKNEWI